MDTHANSYFVIYKSYIHMIICHVEFPSEVNVKLVIVIRVSISSFEH